MAISHVYATRTRENVASEKAKENVKKYRCRDSNSGLSESSRPTVETDNSPLLQVDFQDARPGYLVTCNPNYAAKACIDGELASTTATSSAGGSTNHSTAARNHDSSHQNQALPHLDDRLERAEELAGVGLWRNPTKPSTIVKLRLLSFLAMAGIAAKRKVKQANMSNHPAPAAETTKQSCCGAQGAQAERASCEHAPSRGHCARSKW